MKMAGVALAMALSCPVAVFAQAAAEPFYHKEFGAGWSVWGFNDPQEPACAVQRKGADDIRSVFLINDLLTGKWSLVFIQDASFNRPKKEGPGSIVVVDRDNNRQFDVNTLVVANVVNFFYLPASFSDLISIKPMELRLKATFGEFVVVIGGDELHSLAEGIQLIAAECKKKYSTR